MINNHSNRLPRRTVIKEELIVICQGLHPGVILDRILYRDVQNRRRVENDAGDLTQTEIEKIQEGWQTLKPEVVATQLLLGVTGKTVKRALDKLVELDFLEEKKTTGFVGPSAYRPLIANIQTALEAGGYILEDYPRFNHTPKPAKAAPTNKTVDQQALWDEIPGAKVNITPEQMADVEKGRAWIMGVDFIKNYPPPIQRVAYLVYRETGFEPTGSVADYRKQCQGIWSDANYSEASLLAGLQAGETARKENGLTFSGPRAYSAYIKNIRSLQAQAKKPVKVNGGKVVKAKPVRVN